MAAAAVPRGAVEPTSADRLGPVVRKVLGGLLGLVGRRDGDRTVDDRQLSRDRLIESARGHHVVGPYRPDTAHGEQILALVAVEKLLPQARGRRMRGVLVDRLVVVAGHGSTRWDHH